MKILYAIISALTFRIRGGLRMYKDKKFPLNKLWYAAWFATLACILKGWSLRFWVIMFIATLMGSQIAGWGEACGCALGIAKPNPKRNDYLDFDEFCDNFHIKDWKLIDHPQLYGIVWLTLRGALFTFLIGLALNSLWYMICGIPMGLIYWISGLFARKVLKKKDKTGWNLAEWLFGYYQGTMLCVIC